MTQAWAGRGPTGPWGLYLHVPFCATRCGYCDFNTYTAEELGPGAGRGEYAGTLIEELRLARHALPDAPPVSTVFIGGGTPTLIGADSLVRILDAVRDEFGVEPGAEITTEANPDSVGPEALERLLEGGVTRMSFGVQSLAPHVLRVLDRTHTPGRSLAALREARAAGFAHVSADLIYATPGETDADLAASVDGVLEAGVDHLSAYSLIVEPGTRLARQVARGEVEAPDDDIAAERYRLVDSLAGSAGLEWYEVSNWARAGAECRHNLGYWSNRDWWGAGPGAHGHLSGRRWWNLKHPAAYAEAVRRGDLPVAESEDLGDEERRLERVMLLVRVRGGLPTGDVPPDVRDALAAEGLVEVVEGQVTLTLDGRLLADHVVRRIVD